MDRSLRSAATALGSASRASDSSNRVLALQIRGLDEVTIDDADAADARADQEIARRRADRATTHDDATRGHQALLSWFAKASE